MERELLLEVGCEELPASWLPSLTKQLADWTAARLSEVRLEVRSPIETYSTPRRLTLHIARLAERQKDLEETITGPPVSTAVGPDGQPTAAGLGFARKHAVEFVDLSRVETPKGVYLALQRRQHGRAAAEVLPGVLAAVLRDLAFPKQMHWDAVLHDGRGELLFGRPIRWLLFLYGGRVVPFAIGRAPNASGPDVQDVPSGAVTYGHRFLTTSGRPGRAIKVRSFEEYRRKLAEHFVVLERRDRRERILRELDAHARRLGGRVMPAGEAGLLEEVPDLVEYPSVVTGTFDVGFLKLPPEVLATTMIHHQHYFPVVEPGGALKAAFLAVINTQPKEVQAIVANAERVLAARLRDASFFWDADRRRSLESRLERLDTLLFHQRLGSYQAKAARIEQLAGWIALEAFGQPDCVNAARTAARLSKGDLTTEMVREFTELQGTMGGIYAREEGQPEAVWKAVYYHYLPVGVEAHAPPTRAQLGKAAVTWAAVALADKLDTVFGLYAVGERATGSRDPFGLRRNAHGVLKVLVDLPELTGLGQAVRLRDLFEAARRPFVAVAAQAGTELSPGGFWLDRLRYLLEQRGFDVRNVRAVTHDADIENIAPLAARRKLEVLPEFTETPDFRLLATVFKRVRNIARELDDADFESGEQAGTDLRGLLKEPAELALLDELERRGPGIAEAAGAGTNYRHAFSEAAQFGPAVDRFFTEVFVMVEDPNLRGARLRLMKRLERLILQMADVSEIVPQGG